jgi:putative acetyltransferase
MMYLRLATSEDVCAITLLFRETVKHINAKDYSPQAIKAWADTAGNLVAWHKKIASQHFFLAETRASLLGFASLAEDGYIDFMYVHKDHQGKGVASALLEKLESVGRDAKMEELYSHVSLTAEGWFESKGYRPIGKTINTVANIDFVNRIMKKKI